MSGYVYIVLFALGCVPYSIVKQQKSDERTFEIRALYWSFTRRKGARGNQQWSISLPVIERLRGVVWAVIEQLRKDAGANV